MGQLYPSYFQIIVICPDNNLMGHKWSNHPCTRCDQKITVILKFHELRMFDFRYFFYCYIGTHVYSISWQYQPFWIVSLFLTGKKVSRVWCFSIFYYSKKWTKETVLSFLCKKLTAKGHFKCWLWRLESLLWAEPKFKCGITGLR